MLTYHDLDRHLGREPRREVPCPLCAPNCTTAAHRKKKVLGLWRKSDDAIGYNCPRCGAKGIITAGGPRRELQPHEKILAAERQRQAEQKAAEETRDRTAYTVGLFNSYKPLKSTAGELYLNSRCILLEEQGDLHHAVRFAPMLPLDGKRMCGIVSLFRDIATNDERGIHRIFLHPDGRPVLDADGGKVKRMLGPVAGAAIKLDPDEDVTMGLHIGEGLESCLSARQLGFHPVWALGSAGAIESFPIVSGIETVTAFGERKANGDIDAANLKAARALGRRYVAAGLEMLLADPPAGDLNDLLKKARTQ